MLSVPLQHKPVCSEIIIMVTIDAETARSAIINFKCDLKNLTYKDGNKHKSKACLICNHLLEWNDTGIIPLVRLKKLCKHFLG
jgi:hypothetical protein